jgi:hypothetical protein
MMITGAPLSYIYRGPGTAYNLIGTLYKDVSVNVFGRNEKGDWINVQMPPEQAVKHQVGWIRMVAAAVSLSGDVMSLPVIPSPKVNPAYIINCTDDTLVVTPGDVMLLGQDDSPKNTTRVFPGKYSIYDTLALDPAGGFAYLRTVLIYEGYMITVTEDGTGVSHKCN